ncbi:MAG: hypothetical protein JWP00_4182 [Chloroflexi bacterium]|jgi:hypothetical protein|nr:hypothetical protein [Chloroflexota bacterium]
MLHNKSKPVLKGRRTNLGLFLAGLGSLALVALLLTVSLAGNPEVSAKNQAKSDKKDLVKTLKIVKVDSPTSFTGVGRYPTKPQNGQQLLAVTVAFDRDFKEHLRASESGEVYLKNNAKKLTYYTVDTSFPLSGGPGKKPANQATFVFSVPAGSGPYTFNYDQYSVPLPRK